MMFSVKITKYEIRSVSPIEDPPQNGVNPHTLQSQQEDQQQANDHHAFIPIDSQTNTIPSNPDSRSSTTSDKKKVRFFRITMVLFMLQLAIALLAVGLPFIDMSAATHFVKNNRWLAFTALGVVIVSVLVMTFKCLRNAFRKRPLNYLFFMAYTVSFSYLLVIGVLISESDIFPFALGFMIYVALLMPFIYPVGEKSRIKKCCKQAFRGGCKEESEPGRVCYFYFLLFLFSFFFALMIVLLAKLLIHWYPSRSKSIKIGGLIGFFSAFILAVSFKGLFWRYEKLYSFDEYVMGSLDIYANFVRMFFACLCIRGS